jgi:hypothetical protein
VVSACKDWAVCLAKENQLLPKDRFGPVRPWARWSCVKLTRKTPAATLFPAVQRR